MMKFGTIKIKILQKLTEAYAIGNRTEMKTLLQEVVKNSDFRDMYLVYEEIENRYIEDKKDAELYIESIIPLLKEKKNRSIKFCKELDKKIGDVPITENAIYLFLDKVCENDTLTNIHTKINAKNKLVEHLMKKKESNDDESVPLIENEALLHQILTNNFNVLYNNTLSEEEKKKLTEILSISENDLKTRFTTLQEEVIAKINKMITEDVNKDARPKLNDVLNEAESMKPTKFNYYKLEHLKNGL
jgi:uncharacterized coiled-coil protein SlyX